MILVSVGCQNPVHLAARLGCAETKVATWDDLAFKLITFGWNVKHRNFAKADTWKRYSQSTKTNAKTDKPSTGIGKIVKSQSRHPEIKWAQKEYKAYITVVLADTKDAKVNLAPKGVFSFSTTAG
ncbi:reverse transcriptase domain-containing protein [Tanacetum coccineum]|uniref:Reverse transcriptase domain-containing protein n=1 Tax=Tanacetum coccineum TaxID=301880 RepID=A0ABQ5EW00_9ASTR